MTGRSLWDSARASERSAWTWAEGGAQWAAAAGGRPGWERPPRACAGSLDTVRGRARAHDARTARTHKRRTRAHDDAAAAGKQPADQTTQGSSMPCKAQTIARAARGTRRGARGMERGCSAAAGGYRYLTFSLPKQALFPLPLFPVPRMSDDVLADVDVSSSAAAASSGGVSAPAPSDAVSGGSQRGRGGKPMEEDGGVAGASERYAGASGVFETLEGEGAGSGPQKCEEAASSAARAAAAACVARLCARSPWSSSAPRVGALCAIPRPSAFPARAPSSSSSSSQPSRAG